MTDIPLIQADRLHALMDAFIAHGGEADGGMHRLTLSAEDGAARDHLAAWMKTQGMVVTVDCMGNMVGLLDWAGPDGPVVMTGSHLDSQPHGGRYDGAYGVLAACEAVQSVRDGMIAQGIAPRCNLAIVDWTNEEGARFQPSLLGSAVYAGLLDADDARSRQDGDGVTVAQALGAIGYDGSTTFPKPQAYVELHVECNTVLEREGARFGAITRHWGAVKYRLAFIGRQAHTGPTPMEDRQDALLGAAQLIAALGAMPGRAEGTLYTSVGRLEVRPNSPNVVPGEAVLFLELRSPDQALIDWAETEMLAQADIAAKATRTRHETRYIDRRGVGFFDEGLIALATTEAAALGLVTRRLDTIAAHDAICMIHVCPSVVINVPSIGGVCHHPSERTSPEDLTLGAELLARMLWRLCEEGLAA
ncbi:Zn-dependent hydrolase [Acidisoma cladoniae]|jgi:N-carbamoyl-L-amino-acid hydrolase|uniref:Zn-dependent hydrolase n=1 Tax=Acidisoma cladoniae TaxID=3040935 RepID=UPI00254D9366|nr:Zn-dependent hydrolase [Acidisoma sp. PAMC 29798]